MVSVMGLFIHNHACSPRNLRELLSRLVLGRRLDTEKGSHHLDDGRLLRLLFFVFLTGQSLFGPHHLDIPRPGSIRIPIDHSLQILVLTRQAKLHRAAVDHLDQFQQHCVGHVGPQFLIAPSVFACKSARKTCLEDRLLRCGAHCALAIRQSELGVYGVFGIESDTGREPLPDTVPYIRRLRLLPLEYQPNSLDKLTDSGFRIGYACLKIAEISSVAGITVGTRSTTGSHLGATAHL